jgi:hypothetical protein
MTNLVLFPTSPKTRLHEVIDYSFLPLFVLILVGNVVVLALQLLACGVLALARYLSDAIDRVDQSGKVILGDRAGVFW